MFTKLRKYAIRSLIWSYDRGFPLFWPEFLFFEKILFSSLYIKRPLSKRQKFFFKTDYRLMQVKSVAECSKGAFCNILTFIKLAFVIKIFVFVYFWVAVLHRFYCNIICFVFSSQSVKLVTPAQYGSTVREDLLTVPLSISQMKKLQSKYFMVNGPKFQTVRLVF